MGGTSNQVFTFREKLAILISQNHQCAYCATDLDKHLLGTLAIQFDHFIPRSLGGPSNKLNMSIACCARCNRIKSNKLFDSMRDVRLYIRGALNLPPYDFQTEQPTFMIEQPKNDRAEKAHALLDSLFGKSKDSGAS